MHRRGTWVPFSPVGKHCYANARTLSASVGKPRRLWPPDKYISVSKQNEFQTFTIQSAETEKKPRNIPRTIVGTEWNVLSSHRSSLTVLVFSQIAGGYRSRVEAIGSSWIFTRVDAILRWGAQKEGDVSRVHKHRGWNLWNRCDSRLGSKMARYSRLVDCLELAMFSWKMYKNFGST